MSIGLELHHFREFIFLDHRDCGAFKKFYPEVHADNQLELHTKHMQMAHDKLAALFPNFKFRGYLMDLKGQCIHIPTQHNLKSEQHYQTIEDEFLSSLKH